MEGGGIRSLAYSGYHGLQRRHRRSRQWLVELKKRAGGLSLVLWQKARAT